MVHSLTMEDLRQSKNLRTLILNYDMTLFRNDPAPKGSFERTYNTKRDEEVAKVQQARQKSITDTMKHREEVEEHNIE